MENIDFDKIKKIGLIGFGTVNQAIYKNIIKDKKQDVVIYSLEPHYNDFTKIKDTDICIIAVPTPSTDVTIELEKIFIKLDSIEYKGIIAIKSTIIPSILNEKLQKFEINIYSDTSVNMTNTSLDKNILKVIYWPEFLNEVSATEDFRIEKFLFGGDIILIENFVEILKDFFDFSIQYSVGTSQEVMEYKYFRNAILMNHFNFINHLSQCFQTDLRVFEKFQSNHTYNFNRFQIAPSGKFGVGGKCLPKDLSNLKKYFEKQENIFSKNTSKLLKSIINSNNELIQLPSK